MAESNRASLNVLLSLAGVCCVLLACGFPVGRANTTATNEPTDTRAPLLLPSPSLTSTSTSVPTTTPAAHRDGSDNLLELFDGCWRYESEDVSYEMQLRQEGSEVQGAFQLIKICVVGDLESACRIREGEITGTASEDHLEAQLLIPEYGDTGVVLLTLGEERDTLSWEEVEYPWAGLADGDTRYLPARFALDVCDR